MRLVLSKVLPPISELVNVSEIEKKVKTFSTMELLREYGSRKSKVELVTPQNISQYSLPRDLVKGGRLIILEYYKIPRNTVAASYLPEFMVCPLRIYNMRKLGELLKGEDYMVKIYTLDNVRKLLIGTMLHEEYLRDIEVIYSEYKVITEVLVEKEFDNGVKLIGRCDIIGVHNDKLFIAEVKRRYKSKYFWQVAAYGYCLGVKRLYIVDVDKCVKLPTFDEVVMEKIIRRYVLIENAKDENELIKSVTDDHLKMCKKCIYTFICPVFRSRRKRITDFV